MKAVFLDKDGALVDNPPLNVDPLRMRLCNGAGAALRLLARRDYRFFVVSNQDCIARGRVAEAAMESLEHRLADLLFREQLNLEGFYFCPHHPEGAVGAFALDCTCRQPMPGMLLQAARDHTIALRSSWMVGDVLSAVEAGNRAGCRTILIDKGVETAWRLGPRRIPTRIAPDLYTAAVLIISEDGE